MTSELKQAIQKVVDYLDEGMKESPDQELADVCNYLSGLLE